MAVRQIKVSVRVGGAVSANNTFTSSVLAGSLLLAHTSMWNGGGTGESVISDGTNGTWGSAATTGYFISGDANSELQLNAFPNSGAASITVTSNPPGSAADIDLTLMEITGAVTSSPRDVSVTNTGTFPTFDPFTYTITSGTLAQANELVIVGHSHIGTPRALTTDTGDSFTQADENEDNSTGQCFHLQYKLVSATTSLTANATSADPASSGGVSQTWFAGLASYKEAAAAAVPFPRRDVHTHARTRLISIYGKG